MNKFWIRIQKLQLILNIIQFNFVVMEQHVVRTKYKTKQLYKEERKYSSG